MKYSICGRLKGLTDTYIQGIKTKLSAIPKADYWKQDAQFSKSIDEQAESILNFSIPFHKRATRSNFVKNWIRFYWGTKIVEDPETREETEIRVRKFEVKDAIKTLWSKCKPGSRIWVELHDHDELKGRKGCKIEDIIEK